MRLTRSCLSARRFRIEVGASLAAVTAILGIPSSPASRFDGLPLSSVPEAIALATLLPLVLSSACRRALARQLRRLPAWCHVVLIVAIALATGGKAVLIGSPPSGFFACYQSTLGPPPAGQCERSFENPFFRFRATRIDSTIDFGPGDWNLSFFNSVRFNFFPSAIGVPRRDRLPFTGTWRGTVDTAIRNVDITYVGEGTVTVGGRVVELPASYVSARTVRVDFPAGQHTILASYKFDDGSRVNDHRALGPYATFHLTDAAPPYGGIHPAPPATAATAAAGILDGATTALLVALLCWYVSLLRRQIRTAGIIGVATFILLRTAALPPDAKATAVACSLLALVMLRNRSASLLLAYGILLVTAAGLIAGWSSRGIHSVMYRSAGDDWLTYESQARAVLESGLAGGEQVFYNQPLFRYFRFVEHFLFGDGDLLIDIAAWTALHWSILWSASALFRSASMDRVRRALFVAAAALTLSLADWRPVFDAIRLSLSEHATWIFLACAFALLASRHSSRWPFGAALLAGALITRPNQAPALAMAGATWLIPRATAHRRPILVATIVSAAICVLPLAHNIYYGGRAVLFTTTATHPDALIVPVGALTHVLSDVGVRARFMSQLRALFFLLPLTPLTFDRANVTMHGLQFLWAGGVWMGWRRIATVQAKVLALIPAAYLGVHIVYDAMNYYPRHVLAAYFAMGLVTMTVAAAQPSQNRLRSARPPEAV